ncbi:hypothetical protein [Desertibaculum subflavum]|uniref:hypothetical protein n=1 Tax=Desertibaculum subflavum TaxID=2268458 RepID=UPI000E667A23
MQRQIKSGAAAIALALAALAVPVTSLAQGRPAAMVEEVKNAPGAGVEFTDYVFPGQRIQLGPRGELKLSYLASCRSETIRGGTVTIGESQSSVAGGRVEGAEKPCDTKRFTASVQTAEAGAGVKRLTPFDSKSWAEVALASPRPIFRWEGKGNASIRILDENRRPVWSATTPKSFAEYPANAPPLEPGAPYVVEVSGLGAPLYARFSIDPDLEIADTVANRTVPLTRGP